jgi:hypothetical protein
MGMTGGLVRASAAEIQRLRETPSELPDFLDCNVWAPALREVRPKGVLGWLWKLSPIRIQEVDPEAVRPADANTAPVRPHVDLEKAWHGLHFLFTGTAWEGEEPACFLTRGGEEIGDEDLGYSSIRVLDPHRLGEFARFLDGLTPEELRRWFEPRRMKELKIYPGVWVRKNFDGEAELEYLLTSFDELRRFVSNTVKTGDGAIVFLT